MAGQRLTDKTAITQLGTGDLLMAVDVSDTTGSSAGTSKKIEAEYIIQTDKITISNAELQAMDDSGGAGTFRVLLSAPGAGFMLVPLNITIITTASNADTSNSSLYFGWDSSQTSYYWDYISRFMKNVTAPRTYCVAGVEGLQGAETSSIENKQFVAYSSGNFNSTDLTADVYITYKKMKLS
tara:strand:+ start:724 stop:1269 length:546 start_codon:yes stop_codon:yes gene_type:complete